MKLYEMDALNFSKKILSAFKKIYKIAYRKLN